VTGTAGAAIVRASSRARSCGQLRSAARIGLRGWARRRVAARHTATRDDARDDDARDVDDDARDRGGGRGARPARRSREGEDADADG